MIKHDLKTDCGCILEKANQLSPRFFRNQRLVKTVEIRAVLNSKRSVATAGFVVKWRERGKGEKKSRLCIVVRKKDVGSAAERNRARRLVREFFRLHSGNFQEVVDLVIQVRKLEVDKYEGVEKVLDSQLKRAGIL